MALAGIPVKRDAKRRPAPSLNTAKLCNAAAQRSPLPEANTRRTPALPQRPSANKRRFLVRPIAPPPLFVVGSVVPCRVRASPCRPYVALPPRLPAGVARVSDPCAPAGVVLIADTVDAKQLSEPAFSPVA